MKRADSAINVRICVGLAFANFILQHFALDICLWPTNNSQRRPRHPLYSSTNPANTAIMGRVRTKTVKKSAKVIIERYYPRLTLDFETNKRICDEIAVISSKRLRNKVCAGIFWSKRSEIVC